MARPRGTVEITADVKDLNALRLMAIGLKIGATQIDSAISEYTDYLNSKNKKKKKKSK